MLLLFRGEPKLSGKSKSHLESEGAAGGEE